MTPAARAAELVRDHGLMPDALVVYVGVGGAELLAEFRRLSCRVLALDSVVVGGEAGIDILKTALSPAAARLVRDRYGAVSLLLVTSDVPPAVASICLASDGVVVTMGDRSDAPALARAA